MAPRQSVFVDSFCCQDCLLSELLACRAAARGSQHSPLSPRFGAAAFRFADASEIWWAWEDLNFRPHAYQARALTN
jgi:hypothetical protein